MVKIEEMVAYTLDGGKMTRGLLVPQVIGAPCSCNQCPYGESLPQLQADRACAAGPRSWSASSPPPSRAARPPGDSGRNHWWQSIIDYMDYRSPPPSRGGSAAGWIGLLALRPRAVSFAPLERFSSDSHGRLGSLRSRSRAELLHDARILGWAVEVLQVRRR